MVSKDEKPKALGTPIKPLPAKCLSVVHLDSESGYISIVTMSGLQICVGISMKQMALIAAQAAPATLSMLQANVEPPAA